MHFDGDAFISYAHLDNVELIEGRKGWVANLHRALEVRVAQLLGKTPHIWRDPKLQGNDLFSDTLAERLRSVAALVPVISPRYVKSEWTRKELLEFRRAADAQGGICFQDKARIFKVMKTPVPAALHPPELQSLLGYEFYKVDPDTGRVHELDEIFGPEAQRDFWLRLDDLAHDICCLLEMVEAGQDKGEEPPPEPSEAIYLAFTTFDLNEQRESIKRDLQQHGYTVLPARNLPMIVSELVTAVRDDLERCCMSIHLIGKNYSFVPEGGTKSVLEIQHELAIERGENKGDRKDFSRVVWIPPGLSASDERQGKFVEHLRMDSRVQKGADLLETDPAELRTVIQDKLDKLKVAQQPAPAAPQAGGRSGASARVTRISLIYDQRDVGMVAPWADFLFAQRCEIMQPIFEGDEAEIREYYEETLRTCDGALIFWGSASECWLRRKLRELQKSAGYGRSKPPALVGTLLVPPRTADKERFRTHEATVIPQWEGFSAHSLQPFLSELKA